MNFRQSPKALSHFNTWISELTDGQKNMQDLTYCNLYISYVTYQSN